MLSFHTLAKWMYGLIEQGNLYDLPEDMYNDVIPSGVHDFNRDEY